MDTNTALNNTIAALRRRGVRPVPVGGKHSGDRVFTFTVDDTRWEVGNPRSGSRDAFVGTTPLTCGVPDADQETVTRVAPADLENHVVTAVLAAETPEHADERGANLVGAALGADLFGGRHRR
jgi:hypothetical protein